ncbi:MAG TPA: hypothetical protein VHO25_04945 [Polyangiaceae bacterium]|nr:hypothetical protein [Polyangiaceae bacterium]
MAQHPPSYLTVETAAQRLSTTPNALRARLRRCQRREGASVIADLGGGLRGIKFGRNWRLIFPDS